jgi:HK97 gp10 family phage protein
MSAFNADLSQLAGNLAAASGLDFTAVAAELVRGLAEGIQQEAQELAPKKTGALANSIVVSFTGPTSAVVGPTVPYGVFQEFGTRPHIIRPRVARRLVFKVDGKWVFAREVHHPGTAPQPFMRPAIEHQLQQLQGDLGETAVAQVTRGRS